MVKVQLRVYRNVLSDQCSWVKMSSISIMSCMSQIVNINSVIIEIYSYAFVLSSSLKFIMLQADSWNQKTLVYDVSSIKNEPFKLHLTGIKQNDEQILLKSVSICSVTGNVHFHNKFTINNTISNIENAFTCVNAHAK